MDKLRNSQENFHKKINNNNINNNSSINFYFPQNKSDTYATIIQMLKSDLITIQDMINLNKKDIKMYKLLSKSPGLTKKLNDIEQNNTINNLIEKLNEDCNIEKIMKIYGIKNQNELIQKLFLELEYNDLLIKKTNDFFVLMKLKLCNNDSFQDSISKIIHIKDFFDYLPDLNNNNNNNTTNNIIITNITNNNNNNNNNNENKENKENNIISEYLSIKNIKDFSNYSNKNTTNPIILQTQTLISQYISSLNDNITNVLKFLFLFDKERYSNEISPLEKLEKLIDNLLEIIKNIKNNEKNNNNIKQEILDVKDKYEIEIHKIKKNIENYEKENNELKLINKKLKEENEMHLNNEKNFENIKKDFEKLKYTQKDFDDFKSKCNTENFKLKNEIKELNELLKLNEEELNKKNLTIINNNNNNNNNKISNSEFNNFLIRNEINFSKFKKDTFDLLNNEIKELSMNNDKLTEKYNILKIENEDYKKKLNLLHSKKFSEDSYEQVLLTQFNTMKELFENKINSLNEELTQIKNEVKVQLYQKDQEIKEANRLKDLLMNQIMQQ